MNSLDLNPFQANLLASGASDSEVSIWDLNKFSTPMTPGAKAQPLEDVRCVAWNKQVQHILATTGTFLGTFPGILPNSGTSNSGELKYGLPKFPIQLFPGSPRSKIKLILKKN